jgi:hypothetical protein
VAHIHTIEFQKRGLPHAHILLWLQAGDKPLTPDQIDEICCAEIPDAKQDALGRTLVRPRPNITPIHIAK